MSTTTLLFDLDGTVIDTGPLIAASFRHAVFTVLGKQIDDEEMLAYVGGWSLREQMERLASERSQELVEAYRAYNEPHHEGLEFCEGMRDLLDEISGGNVPLGLVTAKRRATVEIAFGHLPELERLFDVVVTAEDTERHKPHPEPLLYALEQFGVEPESATYVGDSPFDIEAARAAGMRAIAVTWGGIHGKDRLRITEPDALVTSADELRQALALSPA
jgi:pyrophosphatase PpaX